MTRNSPSTRRSGRFVPAALLCLAAVLAAVAPAVTHAAYPEQRINMIVSYNPGGGTDLIARVIAPSFDLIGNVIDDPGNFSAHADNPVRSLKELADQARANPGKEQGFDIVLASLRGIAAPKGLPAPIREQLARAVELAARDPQFQAQAASYFAPLRYLSPVEYEAELREAEEGFKKMWQEIPWGEK